MGGVKRTIKKKKKKAKIRPIGRSLKIIALLTNIAALDTIKSSHHETNFPTSLLEATEGSVKNTDPH